jgi:hypothetical protein
MEGMSPREWYAGASVTAPDHRVNDAFAGVYVGRWRRVRRDDAGLGAAVLDAEAKKLPLQTGVGPYIR